MIVGPHKGVFFMATVLMCAVSLYGAESLSATDPMTRIFVGEPNRLTLPPGFPAALAETSLAAVSCGQEQQALRAAQPAAPAGTEPLLGADCALRNTEPARPPEPSLSLGAASTKSRIVAQPASTGSTVARP